MGTRATAVQRTAEGFRVNTADDAEMIYISAGEFIMGSNDHGPDERPRRYVYLDGYWIYRLPVTVAQYRRFCRRTWRRMPPEPRWGWKDEHPVVNVTWQDAIDYSRWARAALPTEAQWEKAARGTDGSTFPWGSEWDSSRFRHVGTGGGGADGTCSVGTAPDGSGPYGLLDTVGNIRQWCADWYRADYYRSSNPRNPAGPATGSYRVLRGGAWSDHTENSFRCTCRFYGNPAGTDDYVGFRCVIPDPNRK